MAEFIIKRGSIHERFINARSKIQIAGGGFGNGKTASLCIKAIQIAKDYPGANMLLGRATYPKLNDTLRREFFKWFPKSWQKSFDKKENTLELLNGTTINFRYVQQRGGTENSKSSSSTSNLLSATYDFVGIDQMDDPEFDYKDYTDLLGRLRGSTPYTGQDKTMPDTGPRWFVITLNPTRNWIFKRVVREVLNYQNTGLMGKNLREQLETFGEDELDKFISIHTGSTYENEHNLAADFIRTLEATYQGAMKERFLMGGWHAYSGLVYPMFDEHLHMVDEWQIKAWMNSRRPGKILEMFDWGMARPSCYLLAFVDEQNNHVIVDGFYQKELLPIDIVSKIKEIRTNWSLPADSGNVVYADPAIFRRKAGEFQTVGQSVASVIENNGTGIFMQRGNNDVSAGIVKISSYLTKHSGHANPFTLQSPAPFVYFNRDRVSYIEDEMTEYYYKRADHDEDIEDVPTDGNDHSLDALKYGLTNAPQVATFVKPKRLDLNSLCKWYERPDVAPTARNHRYGYGISH